MAGSMQSTKATTQHIWCSVDISKKMEDMFVSHILDQARAGANVSEYVVYLTTLGGSPFSAINLYNFMKAIPQKTTVYAMGNVYSAGIPFFLSFQSRFGVPDCSFLIHQTSAPRTSLPEQFNVFDLQLQVARLSEADSRTQSIILKETEGRAQTPLNAKAIENAALLSTRYSAQSALSHGFIDRIDVPKLPETGVLYLTDQLLATRPG